MRVPLTTPQRPTVSGQPQEQPSPEALLMAMAVMKNLGKQVPYRIPTYDFLKLNEKQMQEQQGKSGDTYEHSRPSFNDPSADKT